jgi:cation transport ATPase
MVLDKSKFVEIPLIPEERTKNTIVSIISKRNKKNQYPGLSSLVPLSYGDSQKKATKLQSLFHRARVELPITNIVFILGLILFFVFIWLAGIRYPDIGWLIVAAALLVFITGREYLYAFYNVAWLRHFQSAASVGLAISIIAFLFSFLRLNIRRYFFELNKINGEGLDGYNIGIGFSVDF